MPIVNLICVNVFPAYVYVYHVSACCSWQCLLLQCLLLQVVGIQRMNFFFLRISKVLPANGHGSWYCSRVALLEEMVTQQGLGSRPAEWAHSLQLIPRSVDQQLLGLLRVRVGGVEKDQGIFGQDCITHLPPVLGAVAFAVFLWFAERSDEQRNPSDAISWHPFCLCHPSRLRHRNTERLSWQVC